MTFIFESIFLPLENTTPTANHTAETGAREISPLAASGRFTLRWRRGCLWVMHVSGPSHSQQLRMTVSSQLKKMCGPTGRSQREETDEDVELEPEKGHSTCYLEIVRLPEV